MKEDILQIKELFNTLLKKDKAIILIITAIQIILNFLDLIGIAVIGMIGSLSVRGFKSLNAGNKVSEYLKILRIWDQSVEVQVSVLAGIAVLALVSKTLISMLLTRKILYYLSRRSALFSGSLFRSLLNCNIQEINSRSIQNTIYSFGPGVTNLLVGVIAIIPSVISDIALLLILFLGIVVVDASLAILTLLIFTTVGIVIHHRLYSRIRILGETYSEQTIASNNYIEISMLSFREIYMRNAQHFFYKKYLDLRKSISDIDAELKFMPNISKYTIEIVIVLSAVIFGFVQFSRAEASVAVAVIVIFLAALTRMGPAFLRIQQSVLTIKSSLSNSIMTINELRKVNIQKLDSRNSNESIKEEISIDLTKELEVKNLTFKYDNSTDLFDSLNLKFKLNKITAIVGNSGSGKSTLFDILMGLLHPLEGEVSIFGMNPQDFLKLAPGKMSYVPQEIKLYQGSIKENLCMGLNQELFSDEFLSNLLKKVQLGDFIANLDYGLQTNIGERGSRLSGGQKQRLALARALVTNPKILLLDEATSALDGSTEFELRNELVKLKNEVTIIMIVHRFSTIKVADEVLYINTDGSVGFFGSSRDFVQRLDASSFKGFKMS